MRGVEEINDNLITKFEKFDFLNFHDKDKHLGKHWICHSCKNHLLKGKMPPLCVKNNLDVQEIPEQLKDLTTLEKAIISLNLVFMKIRIINHIIQNSSPVRWLGLHLCMEDNRCG